MICRERRSWTAKEDQLLREAVEIEDPENPNPSKWHAIAKHVPNRTNKDCRKRWFAKMASDVVKGGWAPDEDERLVKGIERYGTRWSLVASVVQTRNSDQCAKRWTDTLNPAIDRTSWTPEADELLLQAVAEHGKVWTKIVKTYFPGRTGLSAKNRYNSITRFNNVDRNNRSRRRTPDLLPYHRKSESVSSSSSVSPSTPSPSLSLPELPRSPASFHSDMSSAPPNYFFDHLSQWSHSPESEASSYYPSPNIPHVKEEQFSGPIPASLTSNHPHSHSTIEPSISNYPETGLYPTHRIMKAYPEEHGSPNNYPLSPEVPLSYPHQQYPSGYQSSEGPHPISGVYDSPHQQMHWSQGSPHFDGPQGDRKQLVSSFAF